jgi:hypothetical protein
MPAPPVGWPTVTEGRWLACAVPGTVGADASQEAEQPLPASPMGRWLDRRAPGRGQARTEFPRLIAVFLVELPREPLVGTMRRARSGAHERHHGLRKLRIGGLRATGRWWLPVGLALVITGGPVWVPTLRVDRHPPCATYGRSSDWSESTRTGASSGTVWFIANNPIVTQRLVRRSCQVADAFVPRCGQWLQCR